MLGGFSSVAQKLKQTVTDYYCKSERFIQTRINTYKLNETNQDLQGGLGDFHKDYKIASMEATINPFSAGTVLKRQNLTSVDVPALKELKKYIMSVEYIGIQMKR